MAKMDPKKNIVGENAWELVQSLITQAIEMGATDIHFEPDNEFTRTWIDVRFRIDGMLRDIKRIETLPTGLESIISAIKVASNMDVGQKRKGQDGRFAFKVGDKSLDLRAATLPTVSGEKVVLRIIEKARYVMPLEDLGMTEEALKTYKEYISKPQGLALITGPTGCGKTTTLYSTLNHVKSREKSLYTIEDPVESKFQGISQTQIDPEFGVTFATGLRSILRQDAQIVMIGEIRDKETAQISLRAALTGCLIFSTLHTKDCARTVVRLLDMEIEPYLIAETLTCVVAQRLIRLLCDLCKGKGCHYCNQGFRKRVGIYEVMGVTNAIKKLIGKGATAEEIGKVAVEEGMVSLQQTGERLIQKALTTPAELHRVLALEE